MRNLLIILLFAISSCSYSNVKTPTGDPEYAAGVGFGSVCCGTVSDEFLKTFAEQVIHALGNSVETIRLNKDFADGIYKLTIVKPNGEEEAISLIF